jgi:hypothetical protein
LYGTKEASRIILPRIYVARRLKSPFSSGVVSSDTEKNILFKQFFI